MFNLPYEMSNLHEGYANIKIISQFLIRLNNAYFNLQAL